MYLAFDIQHKDIIPTLNSFIFKNKKHNKIIKDSYFIGFNYIHHLFTLSKLVYKVPFLNHIQEYDTILQKTKHIFYVSLDIQRLLLYIEKTLLDKYILVHPNKTIYYKLQNKITNNKNIIVCYSNNPNNQVKNIHTTNLYIKCIGLCETNNVVSIIYKFIVE